MHPNTASIDPLPERGAICRLGVPITATARAGAHEEQIIRVLQGATARHPIRNAARRFRVEAHWLLHCQQTLPCSPAWLLPTNYGLAYLPSLDEEAG